MVLALEHQLERRIAGCAAEHAELVRRENIAQRRGIDSLDRTPFGVERQIGQYGVLELRQDLRELDGNRLRIGDEREAAVADLCDSRQQRLVDAAARGRR